MLRQENKEKKIKDDVINNLEKVYDALNDTIKGFKRGYIYMNRPREIAEKSEEDKKSKPKILVKELKKDVDDLSRQINVYDSGKKVEMIKRLAWKKILNDIINKIIIIDEDIIARCKPSVNEYNRIVYYKTAKKDTNQKYIYINYVKEAKDLIFKKDIPELRLNKQEPLGSKGKQKSSSSNSEKSKEVDLSWIYGTKKELEDLKEKVGKAKMIKYKDQQGKNKRNINPKNLSEFLEYILSGEINEDNAENNFDHIFFSIIMIYTRHRYLIKTK